MDRGGVVYAASLRESIREVRTVIRRSPFHELIGDSSGSGRRATMGTIDASGSRYNEFSKRGSTPTFNRIARERAVKTLTKTHWPEVRAMFVAEVMFIEALDQWCSAEGRRGVGAMNGKDFDRAVLDFYRSQGIERNKVTEEELEQAYEAAELENERRGVAPLAVRQYERTVERSRPTPKSRRA